MSSARKKVIVRRVTGETIPGYLPLSGFASGADEDRTVSLLDLSGRIIEISLIETKMISFVRDFNLGDTGNPERLVRKAFFTRPRNEGLWVRLTFHAGDQLEGLAATDLSLLNSLIEDSGLHITPPDTRSNTQHIFVPRSAISAFQLLAVISNPSRTKLAPRQTPKQLQEQMRKDLQESLFHAPTLPNTRPN